MQRQELEQDPLPQIAGKFIILSLANCQQVVMTGRIQAWRSPVAGLGGQHTFTPPRLRLPDPSQL